MSYSDMDVDGDSFFSEVLEELSNLESLSIHIDSDSDFDLVDIPLAPLNWSFPDNEDTEVISIEEEFRELFERVWDGTADLETVQSQDAPHSWQLAVPKIGESLAAAVRLPDQLCEEDTEEKEEETCCICMDTFDGTRNTTLKCGHKFHTDCIFGNISSASSNKNRCPLCRDEFCPEISVKEVDDLEEQLEAIENTLYDKNKDITNYRRAIYYLYDENEELYNTVTRLQRDKKTATHLSKKFLKTIHRLQLKLSKEIKENGSTKSYKKCRLCDEYGHNIVICHRQSDQSNVLFGKMYYKYARSDLIFNPKKRPAKEIITAIFPGGELYDAIDDHFV